MNKPALAAGALRLVAAARFFGGIISNQNLLSLNREIVSRQQLFTAYL